MLPDTCVPAVRLVVPEIDRLPESVIALSAVIVRLPRTVDAPRSMELMSLSTTLPLAITNTAPIKSLPASRTITVGTNGAVGMSPSDVRLVVPVIVRTPESVIEPLAVMTRLPLTVEAPRSMSPMSLSETSLPLTTLTAPLKLLTASSVISLADPAVRLVVPVIERLPLSVIEPLEVTVRLPVTVDAARSSAPVSASDTFLPLTTLTAPTKLLASSSVMSLAAPAPRLVVPAIERLPLSVIVPLAVTARLPLIVEAPRSMELVSTSVTFLPLTTLTEPVKSLALSSVMSLPEPAVSSVLPLTDRLPLSVIAPPAVT